MKLFFNKNILFKFSKLPTETLFLKIKKKSDCYKCFKNFL